MNNLKLAGVALLAGVLIGCGNSEVDTSLSSSIGNSAPVPSPPLGHAGRWITDAQGRVVILHGFNMISKEPPYTLEALGFGDDDAEFLARNGFNAVRVGFMWKATEPEAGVYDDAYLDSIARTIQTLGRHGVLSQLDFHQDYYHEKLGGQGFPDWAVYDDGLPNIAELIFANPAQMRSWDNFWANVSGPDGVGLQQRFIAFWQHVARRFRGNDYLVGYDLMNEPQTGSQWPLCASPAACPFEATTLTEFYRRVIPQIRAVDPETLVWYEPNILAGVGAKSDIGNVGDSNAGLSFHVYCLITALSQVAQIPGELRDVPCPINERLLFDQAEAHSQATGAALLMTEFGSNPNMVENIRVAAAADEYRVGWMNWVYTISGGSFPGTPPLVKDPRLPPEGDNVTQALLAALARPYPQIIAGTPQVWSFDPTSKQFAFDYTPARADGQGRFADGAETTVFVPEIQYPNGYRVEVTGGRVLSAPNARLLVVAANPGTDKVEVRLLPAG